MYDQKAFTVDPVSYAGIFQFVEELKQDDKHIVPLIEPGVAQRIKSIEPYEPYLLGSWADLFIKTPQLTTMNLTTFTGLTRQGDTVFPDFFDPATQDFWSYELNKLETEIRFDGVWLSMNEV